jgi:hypothetical protein
MSSLLVFHRVYKLFSLSCWYFRPSFVNYSPPNLLSGYPDNKSAGWYRYVPLKVKKALALNEY